MYATYCHCARCGEAYTETEPDRASYLPAHDPRSDMCGACQRATDGESEAAAPIACLDDGTHVAEYGATDIDEPECETWSALAAEFDELDLGLARREHVREMLVRAWAAGAAHVRVVNDYEDSDPCGEILDILREHAMPPDAVRDIQDCIHSYTREISTGETEWDARRDHAIGDARISLDGIRETLRDLRRHAGTPLLPAARVSGEILVVDARLGDVDDLLEAVHSSEAAS